LREITIILLLFSISSCSVLKHESRSDNIYENGEGYDKILESIRMQNISNQSFYISKAEIELTSEREKQSFICSIKFSFPDKYLISLRSKTGIEAARLLLTRDTLIINDRINRKLYYGDPDYIRKEFGIPPSGFPVIFGDLIFNDIVDSVNIQCENGSVDLIGSEKGVRYISVVDCRKRKLMTCTQENSSGGERVKLGFNKYLSFKNILVPANVNIAYQGLSIVIRIRKLEIPWEGNFDFIPGSKYELIPLI